MDGDLNLELNDKCALVIGASSGIGEAVVRRLARQGYRVTLVARREEKLQALAERINNGTGELRAWAVTHDVREFDEVPDLFDNIVRDMGGLNLVIYASGVLAKVEPDEYNFDKDRQMVEVNLLGMIAWLNQAADFFARMDAGTIVGIGSIAGDRGRNGQPGYNTSKGAQAIFLESLRNRLDRKGVRVVTIKPGFIDTEMVAGMGSLPMMISPDAAARLILRAARKSHGTVYVPGIWRFVGLILRHIPSWIFRKLP